METETWMAAASANEDCVIPEARLQKILELESWPTESFGFRLCHEERMVPTPKPTVTVESLRKPLPV